MTTDENFHARPPLGLPTGSVRALLTLLILAVVVHEVVLGRQVAVIWTETLVIALAYYFTYRRFASLPREVILRLEREGGAPTGVKSAMAAAAHDPHSDYPHDRGAGAYLCREKRLLEPQVITIFGTALCYLLGVFISGVTSWWSKGHKTLTGHFWEDMKAAVVLLTVAATASLHFLGGADMVPHWLETTTVGLVLFYFGSR